MNRFKDPRQAIGYAIKDLGLKTKRANSGMKVMLEGVKLKPPADRYGIEFKPRDMKPVEVEENSTTPVDPTHPSPTATDPTAVQHCVGAGPQEVFTYGTPNPSLSIQPALAAPPVDEVYDVQGVQGIEHPIDVDAVDPWFPPQHEDISE